MSKHPRQNATGEAPGPTQVAPAPHRRSPGFREAATADGPGTSELDALQRMADQSPQVASLAELQRMADASPQVAGLSEFQRMADESPQVAELASLQRMADQSPQVARQAEFQRMADDWAAPVQRVELEDDELQMVQRQELEDEELLQGKALQRAGDEEDLLQGKLIQREGLEDEDLQMVQRQALEDEEPLQGKLIQREGLEDEDLQMVQRQALDEEPLQGMALQREEAPGADRSDGLPRDLRAGMEQLSGMSLADVNVHRNSAEPAKVGAHAYAQGREIHLAPGQEQHLPHEAWHVVQQAQGRVRPTLQAKGVAINDDPGLEAEADVMGEKANRMKRSSGEIDPQHPHVNLTQLSSLPESSIQKKTQIHHTYGYITPDIGDQDIKYKVGKKVVAKLDHNDPIKGSATGAHWDWMGPMREKYGSIVKGHLLNHDLGGFAVEENLYPITVAANRDHSEHVEQEVKKLLFDESRKKQTKQRLIYQVEVKEETAHDPTVASFICSWGWEAWPWGMDQQKTYEVKSEMEAGSNYGGYRGLPNNKYAMPGNEISSEWYHGVRREEQEDVVKDWANRITSRAQITLSNEEESWWWPFSAIEGIKAVKTSVNHIPAIEKGIMLATEEYIPPYISRYYEEIASDLNLDKPLMDRLKRQLEKSFTYILHVGEGRAKLVNKTIYEHGVGKLMEEMYNIVFWPLRESIRNIFKNLYNDIDDCGDGFILNNWSDQQWELIDVAKNDIHYLVVERSKVLKK